MQFVVEFQWSPERINRKLNKLLTINFLNNEYRISMRIVIYKIIILDCWSKSAVTGGQWRTGHAQGGKTSKANQGKFKIFFFFIFPEYVSITTFLSKLKIFVNLRKDKGERQIIFFVLKIISRYTSSYVHQKIFLSSCYWYVFIYARVSYHKIFTCILVQQHKLLFPICFALIIYRQPSFYHFPVFFSSFSVNC